MFGKGSPRAQTHLDCGGVAECSVKGHQGHRPTSTGGIEQSRLEADGPKLLQAVVNGDVDGVAEVRVHARQGKQVRRPHKEVAVECVETHT